MSESAIAAPSVIDPYRLDTLQELFDLFDLEKTGTILSWELKALGTERNSSVSELKLSKSLIKRMDENRSGEVSKEEFVVFLDGELPGEKSLFDEDVQEFRSLAQHVTAMRAGKRENIESYETTEVVSEGRGRQSTAGSSPDGSPVAAPLVGYMVEVAFEHSFEETQQS